MIEVKTGKDIERNAFLFSARIDNLLLIREGKEDIYRNIALLVAERYVKENYQEIIKHIDQKAIATLSVAESSAKIRETLEKKIPDKILEVVKKEPLIIQKSIFGTKIIG